MKKFVFLFYSLISFLPATKCYRFKAFCFRLFGFNIDKSCRIVSSARIFGNVNIGTDTFVGHDVLIASGIDPVVIGNYVDIAPRVVIVNGSHELTPCGPRMAGSGLSKKIIIGNGAWIGTNVTIIGGVEIGEMSMIGAGSVVVHNLPSYTISAGNPARAIKYWDHQNQKWVKI